ncbi:MAG: ABC transporter ATP-binding protein [Planctomycetes bacterium]|nr:ABC transporter ATP-binding protein [Planctomycetota bacterium]
MPDFAVELLDVSKHFGPTPVVDRVSLSVRRGEFFSLLGPSGCGKTTTLRLIAGFATPDSGELRINGTRANEVPPQRRDVNLVFQNYALFPHLTVERNVAFGLEIAGVRPADIAVRVRDALDMVQLNAVAARRPNQLSGGQQQRVALARALVTRPAVLLLDEPLGALDLKLRKDMQLELRALQKKLGLTFIHVTHDQEEALTLSDRLAVMHRGRVAQQGTPAELYERPATRFVADFLGESNFLEGEVVSAGAAGARARLDGLGAEVELAADGLRAGQRVTFALRPERVQLRTGGGGVPGWPATVEDVAYGGRDTRYRVAFLPGKSLLVRAPNAPRAQVGERVAVGWEPADLRLVSGD